MTSCFSRLPFRLIPMAFAASAALCSCSSGGGAEAAKSPEPSYSWENVAIGGGGAVPGVLLHPLVKDLAYIRTDVGGAYRWSEEGKSWTPLMESTPFKEWNLYGVESFAVDPSDASGNTLYVSTGKYTDSWAEKYGVGVVMKSTDRGRTWTRTSLQVGGSNGDQLLGERLAVDPFDGRHILYASRLKGLCESVDGAESWRQVGNGPEAKNDPKSKGNKGLAFAVFDASSGRAKNGFTKRVYVGAANAGVFLSDDGGASWTLMEGAPGSPHRAAMSRDGDLYLTHAAGLAKFDGSSWTDATPEKIKRSFNAIAVDPSNPQRVVVAVDEAKPGGPVFLSSDGGASWKKVSVKANGTVPWWNSHMWLCKIFSLAFDPFDSKRVWATDWYGAYRTDDVDSPEAVWTNYEKGHEEVVSIGALAAPPNSKYRLYSGVADVAGFDHEAIDKAPSKHIWSKGFAWNTTTGIAWRASDPDFLVRVGCRNWNLPSKGGACTLDGGDSWIKFPSVPYDDIRGGRALIAGKGRRIIWLPQIGEPYLTDDLGKTWRKLAAPVDLHAVAHGDHIFFYDQPAVVDLANPDRVYIQAKGKMLRSDDAGDSWRVVCEKSPGCKALLTTGLPNEAWLADSNGLWRSMDAGASWSRLPEVDGAVMACVGKNPPGKDHAALFLSGTVKGVDGFYRSDDLGSSWLRIDDEPGQRIGDDPNTMCGDWRVFGGVFVGTNGRGIYYGAPRAR